MGEAGVSTFWAAEQLDQQRARFAAFGIHEMRRVFSVAEQHEIRAEAEALLSSSARETRQDALRNDGSSVVHSVERSPVLTRLLLEDGRIRNVVANLLGDDFIWCGSELERAAEVSHHEPELLTAHRLPQNYNEHGWHSDRHGTRECAYPRLKFMMYLTHTSPTKGALRIIAGSHRPPFHYRLSALQATHPGITATESWRDATFGIAGDCLPSHIFCAEPCDAILFHQSCFHAVYGHQPGRTYIAMKFAARPRTDEELACLGNRGAYAFEPHPNLELASAHPAVRNMVRGLRSLASAAENALSRDSTFAEQEGFGVDIGYGAPRL